MRKEGISYEHRYGTLQLPADVFQHLKALAAEEKVEPDELIGRRYRWPLSAGPGCKILTAPRGQIDRDGGLSVGQSAEAVVEQMRQARQEIFEAEYAHLNR